eukprot:360465-Chlamydomonas_euryale.AAC.18
MPRHMRGPGPAAYSPDSSLRLRVGTITIDEGVHERVRRGIRRAERYARASMLGARIGVM